MMQVMRRDLVSKAAQTVLRENESQTLNWDITAESAPNPSKFPKGRGLKYPIIYNPAWPPDISRTRKERPPRCKKESVVGSWAVTGVTANSEEIKPIKKTLIFPHRVTEIPFKQPVPKVVKKPTFEPFDKLQLKGVGDLEPAVVYRSLLERLRKYDPYDPKARAMALRVLLQLPIRTDSFTESQPNQLNNRLRNRVIISAKGKHRILTPRCDSTIIQQLGRRTAIILLQKCLRGRAAYISMMGTHSRWVPAAYDELNELDERARAAQPTRLCEEISDATAIRIFVGECMAELMKPLKVATFDPLVVASYDSTLRFIQGTDEQTSP